MRRIARPNRMRISSGIAPHLGGHQPMRTHSMSHIVVDSLTNYNQRLEFQRGTQKVDETRNEHGKRSSAKAFLRIRREGPQREKRRNCSLLINREFFLASLIL